MINHCANTACSKPLLYLREGRIFVFDVADTRAELGSNGARPRRIEHFWLCGECSQAFLLERTAEEGVRVIPRQPIRSKRAVSIAAARAS